LERHDMGRRRKFLSWRRLAGQDRLPRAPGPPIVRPMKSRPFAALLALSALSGCVASGPALQGSHSDSAAQSPLGSPFSGVSSAARDWPLVLDRTDLSLGTTVLFDRVPNASEIHDLDAVLGMQHLVISLPGWPTDPALI